MTTFSCDSIPARSPSTRYQIAIFTDLGSVASSPNYDWDDYINLAIALCTQDKFALRLVCTELSDQVFNAPGTAIDQIYDAYESDLVGGTLPAVSLTRKQLQSITVLGPVFSPPSTGYRVHGDSDYVRAHNCSQAFIKMARDCGDPGGTYLTNPYGKIWVALNGGYSVFAQILREAITGTELPDILDRCVFFGCPFFNAGKTETAWAYWCANHYQVNSSTPGIFGSVKMISVYPTMEAIMTNNEAGQQTLWATMKTQGAMGVLCESARVANVATNGSLNVPRAGESTAMQWWLLEAERLASWDPTNTSNTAGAGFQLYDNNNWPYAHGGAGFWTPVSTSGWPVAETEFSPSHWGGRSARDTLAEVVADWNMSGYRTWLGTNWARYA